MNTTYLRLLRKHYNYKFGGFTTILLKRKSDGYVGSYTSIAQAIRDVLTDRSRFVASHKWKNRKNRIIFDSKWNSNRSKLH